MIATWHRLVATGIALGALIGLGTVGIPALAQAGGDPWLWVSRTSSSPANVVTGQAKGEITIATKDGRSFRLSSLSNSTNDGFTSLSLAPNQCPQLIVRYSAALGYGSGSVGDGKDAADAFASRSRGQFSYQIGGHATQPPLPGAVVSISGRDSTGKEFAGGFGHVGIVQSVSGTDPALTVTLFDQNWPTHKTGAWKKIAFRKVNGVWQGTFENTPKDTPTQYIAVAGWANPVATTFTPPPATTQPRNPPSGTNRNNRPDTPKKLLPGKSSAPGTSLPGSKITITWGSASGATSYDLRVRDTTDKRSAASETLTGTYFSVKVKSGHTYRWSVKACNDAGCSAASDDLYFTAN